MAGVLLSRGGSSQPQRETWVECRNKISPKPLLKCKISLTIARQASLTPFLLPSQCPDAAIPLQARVLLAAAAACGAEETPGFFIRAFVRDTDGFLWPHCRFAIGHGTAVILLCQGCSSPVHVPVLSLLPLPSSFSHSFFSVKGLELLVAT